MDFVPSKIPADRHKRYNTSERGQAREAKYRAKNPAKSTEHTAEWRARNPDKGSHEKAFLEREFIGWDGEGITLPDGSHIYTSLANSKGDAIRNDKGLETWDIIRMLLNANRKYPDAIHVIYGGGYDTNMWLSSLPQLKVEELYVNGTMKYGPYQFGWMLAKSFTIKLYGPSAMTIYDVVSFFQKPFLTACEEYLGDRMVEHDLIRDMKQRRGGFTTADNDEVERYNAAELENLVMLMTELRLRLHRAGLRPRRWDGPGAIAAALLTKQGIKHAMKDPESYAIREAARTAYTGGRFELIKFGSVDGKAYEYDINSAYPHALRRLPNLARGSWEHINGDGETRKRLAKYPTPYPFALMHITYRGLPRNMHRPGPLFVRADDGSISYPQIADGWYWAPEAMAAIQYVKAHGGALHINSAYLFVEDDVTDKPFEFVEGHYLKRAALKRAGDGAHVGYKLGLNSIYGKLCQQTGARKDPKTGLWRVPPFHQIEWAGYVTSTCKAMVLTAIIPNLDNVIAFETDAVFTTCPLSVTVGNGLGEWEATEFDSLTYVQSGFYFGTVGDKPIVKTRGVDRGSLALPEVISAFVERRKARAKQTRFIGAGLARQLNDWEKWQRWVTSPKMLSVEPSGKRIHMCLPSCAGELGVWHSTVCPKFGGISAPYPVRWIAAVQPMPLLEELRDENREAMSYYYE